MLVDAARESDDALLIRHRGLPQVHRAAIRQRQRQADRRQALIAVEQHTALVMAQNRTALWDQQGLIRASLTVGAEGFPGLVFYDQHGEVRVFLGVVDGEPILGLRDRSGTQRAMVQLGKADGAPLLFVTDTDGTMLWQAP